MTEALIKPLCVFGWESARWPVSCHALVVVFNARFSRLGENKAVVWIFGGGEVLIIGCISGNQAGNTMDHLARLTLSTLTINAAGHQTIKSLLVIEIWFAYRFGPAN